MTCSPAVTQYAVLEANAKVNVRGPFSHPHPFETPQPISMSYQIYYYVPKGVDAQNLVGNDVISQPLVPFGGHINIAPWRFQAKRTKY